MADIRIEFPAEGRTYVHEDMYGVYEYSTYDRSSVLAGQEKRVYLNEYPTLRLALNAHPGALITESALSSLEKA